MNVLLLLIVLAASNGQFLEQPDPGTVFSPLQDQVTLTCSVEKGYNIDWSVVFPNGDNGEASDEVERMFILQQNFTLEGVATNKSTLSLWETVNRTNNGTNITCIAQKMATIMSTLGNTVKVIFYGTPPPPTDLNVSDDELGSLNISWSQGFIEGIPVNYTLIVLNLNTTSAQPIIIAGLLDQHYVFETSRPCDVYSFTVTAVTAAGNSTLSQEITINRSSSRHCCLMHTCSTTTEDVSGPISTTVSSTELTTTSCSNNSTIIVSVVFTVLLSVSVLGNAIMCARYKKKTKTENTSDLPDPVYETPKDVTSTKSAETPFAMTASSAYGVSQPQVNSIPTTLSSAYNSS